VNLDNDQSNPSVEPEFKTACGGKIKTPSKFPSAEYRGEQVFFCTRACLRVFEQDPDVFISGEVEHPLDEDE
jgi:YHS domain-containing protein